MQLIPEETIKWIVKQSIMGDRKMWHLLFLRSSKSQWKRMSHQVYLYTRLTVGCNCITILRECSRGQRPILVSPLLRVSITGYQRTIREGVDSERTEIATDLTFSDVFTNRTEYLVRRGVMDIQVTATQINSYANFSHLIESGCFPD